MKKKLSIIAVLLLAVVTTAYSVSGTYAKYTSTFNGTSDSARVAKWAFAINDTDVDMATNTFTFNLFDTINDTNEADETDVAETEKIIAPGTRGSFTIKLANKSEVTSAYTIDLTEVNTDNIPVEFSTNGDDWYSDINYLDVASTNLNIGADSTLTIEWQWPFEDSVVSGKTDSTDTTLGIAGDAEFAVTAEIVAIQVD